jgi:hypothetical protein
MVVGFAPMGSFKVPCSTFNDFGFHSFARRHQGPVVIASGLEDEPCVDVYLVGHRRDVYETLRPYCWTNSKIFGLSVA